MVICGCTGTGKTHVSKALVRWLTAVNEMIPVVNGKFADAWFYRWPEVVDCLKSGGWDVVDEINSMTLAVLDDVGAEHDPSRVGIDKLCTILNRREKKWTVVSTNLPVEQWAEKLDERVASRLMRGSTIVDLTGVPDFYSAT